MFGFIDCFPFPHGLYSYLVIIQYSSYQVAIHSCNQATNTQLSNRPKRFNASPIKISSRK